MSDLRNAAEVRIVTQSRGGKLSRWRKSREIKSREHQCVFILIAACGLPSWPLPMVGSQSELSKVSSIMSHRKKHVDALGRSSRHRYFLGNIKFRSSGQIVIL